MVEQDRHIVAFVDVFAHSPSLSDAASGGELDPKRLKMGVPNLMIVIQRLLALGSHGQAVVEL